MKSNAAERLPPKEGWNTVRARLVKRCSVLRAPFYRYLDFY